MGVVPALVGLVPGGVLDEARRHRGGVGDGAYSAELDTAYTVAVDDGQLRIHAGVGRDVALVPDMEVDAFRPAGPVAGSFSFAGARLRLVRGAGGAVVGFSLDVGRARDIRFSKR